MVGPVRRPAASGRRCQTPVCPTIRGIRPRSGAGPRVLFCGAHPRRHDEQEQDRHVRRDSGQDSATSESSREQTEANEDLY